MIEKCTEDKSTFDDEKTKLKKLTMAELKTVLSSKEKKYSSKDKKEDLINKIIGVNEKSKKNKDPKEKTKSSDKTEKTKSSDKTKKTSSDNIDKISEIELTKLTIPELKTILSSNEIKYSLNDKKEDLIDKITNTNGESKKTISVMEKTKKLDKVDKKLKIDDKILDNDRGKMSEDELTKLTIPELKTILDYKKITYISKCKKGDLIKKILDEE